MYPKEAAAILAPLLRTNDFFGLGPFRRPSDKPMNEKWRGARLLHYKVAKFLVKFWWFRGFCLLGMKYFLARRSFGAAVGDFVRTSVGTSGLLIVSSNKKKLNDALERLDEFAHEESQAEWLSRLAFRMNICIWVYVVSRLLVDLTAFYSENLLASFIRTELFIDPAEIPSAALPLALTYALVDLTLNRILTSAGLCLSPFTYIVMNFLVYIKFRKLDVDIRHCLKDEATPHEVRKLRLIHADLSQMIIFMDDIFSPLAILFHGGVVAGFCGETIRLIERFSKGVDVSESLSFLSILFSLAFLFLVISLVTISTAEVCDCPKKSIQAINEFLQGRNTMDIRSGTHQIRLFLSQMDQKNVQMTAWRFYKLDRSALMTTYGASVSYVSLVLQSAPKT